MRAFFAVIIAALPGWLGLYSAPGPVWEELTPMPEGRSGMIAFLSEDSEPAYFGGSSWGENGKRIHSSGYSLRNGNWFPLQPLESPIAYAAVAAKEGLVYAAGGTDGIDIHPAILVLVADRESRRIQILPTQARVYAGAAWIGQAFYQVGGSSEFSALNSIATISQYESGSWNELSQLPEGPLINPAVTSWNGHVLVVGGGTPGESGLKNTDSVYAFEPLKRRWMKRGVLPAPVRGAVAVSVPEEGVIVIGGYLHPPEFSRKVLLLDPEKGTGVSLPELPGGLMLPAVVSNGKSIFVMGGEDAAKHRTSRVFRADLSNLIQKRGN